MDKGPIFVRRRRIVIAAVLAVIALGVSGVAIAGGGLPFRREEARGQDATNPDAHPSTASVVPTPSVASPESPSPSPRTAPNIYAAAAAGDLSPRVRGVRTRVYVPNSESNTVDVIDPRTYRIVASYPVGVYPQHITPSWNLRWLYVDNTSGNSLTVIDPRTGRPTHKVIPVTDPYNLYFTPDGRKAIVVNERFQRLDFRNPNTWGLIKSVAIPSAGPDHLDFSANGRSLLVSCEFSGWVYRVATDSMRVTGKLFVGGLPIDVRLSPDGRVYYVANQGLAGVTLVGARTLAKIGFLHTGTGAHGLAVSRNAADLYVSNRLEGTISVVRFAKRKVVKTWHVGGSPDMLQVSANGRQIWTANRFNGTVSVIDARTGKVLHVIRVGSSPHGLALFPQPGTYSLGHNGVYR
jgi:YVTN family beta-propeller protein